MDIDCPRCLIGLRGCLPPEERVKFKEVIITCVPNFSTSPLSMRKLDCARCQECIALQINDQWQPIDCCLLDPLDRTLNGWLDVRTAKDNHLIYIMSQIIHNASSDNQTQAHFDLPDERDEVRILWGNGQALGYYSLKVKGSAVYDLQQSYDMHTLDTALILPRHRRQGYATSLIYDIINRHPGENIGFSTPISKPMQCVIHKFLCKEPSYKMKMWEIDGTGSQHGGKKLLFYTLTNRKIEKDS